MTKKNSFCPICKQNKKNADHLLILFKTIHETQTALEHMDYVFDNPIARVEIAKAKEILRDGYNLAIKQ